MNFVFLDILKYNKLTDIFYLYFLFNDGIINIVINMLGVINKQF